MAWSKLTPQDTHDLFITADGGWSWFGFKSLTSNEDQDYAGWTAVVLHYGDDGTTEHVIDHTVMLRTLRKLNSNLSSFAERGSYTYDAIRALMHDKDDADYDVCVADSILQFAILGEVVYG